MLGVLKLKRKSSKTKPRIRTGGRIFEWRIFQWLRLGIVFLIAQFMKLWWSTLRVNISMPAEGILSHEKPLAIMLWHNHLFMAAYWYKWSRKRKVVAMISAGTIGAWISLLFKQFGVDAVRGSVNLRREQALKELIQAAREGKDIVVTPDGSRGPCYKFKPGIAKAIQVHDCGIAFLACKFHNAWRLNTWDRFYLPKPFSKIETTLVFYPSSQDIVKSNDPDEITKALSAELLKITTDEQYQISLI